MLMFLSMVNTDEGRDLMIELYCRYRALLYRAAYKYLGNAEDAEDVAQDVYCLVADEYVAYLLNRNELVRRRFLYVCARNRAINIAKKKAKLVSLDRLVDDGFDISSDTSDDYCIEKLCDSDMIERARAKLAELEPLYKDVLWLHFEGFGYEAIAKLFKEKPETMRKRIYRGRKLLSKALGMEGGDAE